jgi:hypothetical protein
MTGWTLKAAKVVAMVGLLIAGIGVSTALADSGNGNGNGNGNGSPTTVPGSPGDDCSHGNSGKDCRPDPNQNGKDCEDHGNAKGNEDHCDQAETTTTVPTTTNETTTNETTTTNQNTTTNETTTTTTKTETGSTPPTTTSSSTPGNGGSSGGPGVSSAPEPAVSTPAVQKKPAHKVRGARASGVAAATSRPGELPFTGFPAWALALIGSAMLAAGLGLRRVGSKVAS